MAGVYLAVALLAQVSVLHYLSFRGAEVSPVLIVVVWYAVSSDMRRATLYGLIAGLCEDILSTGTGGAWTIATTLTAILASSISSGFFADSIPLVAGIVIGATLARNLIYWLVMEIQGYPAGLGGIHFHQTLWQALLNGLLVTVVMVVRRHREVP